jgi:hypothetical protein
MGMAVVTIASGGLAVTDVTATTGIGKPVSESTGAGATPTKFGIAVTKVASGGMPVVYGTP